MYLTTIITAALASTTLALPTWTGPHRTSNMTAFRNSTLPGHTRQPFPKFLPLTPHRTEHAPARIEASAPMLCALHAEACSAAMPYEGDYCWRVVYQECCERCRPDYYIILKAKEETSDVHT